MDFVKVREDFIGQFLNHLGTSAMMDFLLQMVAAPENDRIRIELAEVRGKSSIQSYSAHVLCCAQHVNTLYIDKA